MEQINLNKTLLLDVTSVTDINQWKQANNEAGLYFPEDQTANEYVLADLSQITDLSNGAAWLKRNQGLICFKESYINIHDLHLVDRYNSNLDDDVTRSLSNPNSPKPLIISALDLCQNSEIGPGFNKYNYDKYIVFEVVSNEVVYSVKSFDKNKSCFSFPFFRSILEINKVVSDFHKCIFNFAEVTVVFDWKPYNIIAFKVDFPDGTKSCCYDYSHIPPTGSSASFVSPEVFKIFI